MLGLHRDFNSSLLQPNQLIFRNPLSGCFSEIPICLPSWGPIICGFSLRDDRGMSGICAEDFFLHSPNASTVG
jgi:hypothetical protein